ncbi:unnamed protein product [Tenebrio molitor]|nr:unnamed protein product [Tenebrio molitor]
MTFSCFVLVVVSICIVTIATEDPGLKGHSNYARGRTASCVPSVCSQHCSTSKKVSYSGLCINGECNCLTY